MAMPSVDPSAFGATPDVFSQGFTMPPPQTGGMFGNPYAGKDWWRQGAADALTAFGASLMARSSPQVAQQMMAGVQNERIMNRQAQLAMLQSNLEFQRQMQLAQLSAQLKMQYPDSPLAQALYAQGLRPGDPQFQQAMQKEGQNLLNPVIPIPLYGAVTRDQVVGAPGGQPAPQGVTFTALPPQQPPAAPGGPTPSASGGFY
jgi:hypothetical protein